MNYEAHQQGCYGTRRGRPRRFGRLFVAVVAIAISIMAFWCDATASADAERRVPSYLSAKQRADRGLPPRATALPPERPRDGAPASPSVKTAGERSVAPSATERVGQAIAADAGMACGLVVELLRRSPTIADGAAYDAALAMARRARNEGVPAESLLPAMPTPEPPDAPTDRVDRLREVLARDGSVGVRLQAQIHNLKPGIRDGLAYDIGLAVARSARNHGLRPELVVGVISTESDFNTQCSSSTRDFGLMQLHGRPIFDVRANIEDGCRELAEWRRIAGTSDERAMLVRYNGGGRGGRLRVCQAYASRVLNRGEW